MDKVGCLAVDDFKSRLVAAVSLFGNDHVDVDDDDDDDNDGG